MTIEKDTKLYTENGEYICTADEFVEAVMEIAFESLEENFDRKIMPRKEGL